MINLNIKSVKNNHNASNDLENWKKRLMNLSSHKNNLINFHESKRIIELKPPETNPKEYFSTLEDKIANGNEFSIIYEPSKETLSSERIWNKINENSICSYLKKDELETRLNKIYALFQEDNKDGIPTLFLTIGQLKWYELNQQLNKTEHTSPLIFIPLYIDKNDTDYYIHAHDQAPGLNLFLFELLKNQNGVEIPELKNGLFYDEHGIDICRTLDYVTEVISKYNKDWSVNYSVYISYFTKGYKKFDEWKTKLLDLAAKNYDLLNFKESNKKTLKLTIPGHESVNYLASLEDELSKGTVFLIKSASDIHDLSSEEISTKINEKILFSSSQKKELENRLLDLFNKAELSNDESGTSTLFLAIGMLERFESESSSKPVYAPLIFIPLEIIRTGLSGFQIFRGDDEARVNVTLLSKLKEDFNLRFPLIEDSLPTDENGIDILQIMSHFKDVIAENYDTWNIIDSAYIGHFSYSKYLMWKDLDDLDLDLLIKKHPLFAKLVDPEHRQYRDEIPFPDEASLDDMYLPQDILCPMSCDSSQLAAVISSHLGKSFVLHGPPGTGKSQTITNIIAQCLYDNKSVLFVSEKRVALDVVYNRLKYCKLDPFCLVLHSNKSSKREVLGQFAKSVDAIELSNTNSEYWIEKCNEIIRIRRELNQYVTSVHSIRETGESYFNGISRLSGLRNIEYIPLNWNSFSQFNREELEKRRMCVKSLKDVLDTIGNPTLNSWHPSRNSEWSPQYRESIKKILNDIKLDANKYLKLSEWGYAILFRGCQNSIRIPIQEFIEIISLLNNARLKISKPLLTYSDFESEEGKFVSLFKAGIERDTISNQIFEKYSPEILDIDLEELNNLVTNGGILKKVQIKKILKPLTRENIPPVGKIKEDITLLLRLKELQEIIKENDEVGSVLFNDDWNDGNPNWDKLKKIVLLTKKLRNFALQITQDEEDLTSIYENWSRVLAVLSKKSENSEKIRNGFLNLLKSHNKIQTFLEGFTSLVKMGHIGISQDNALQYVRSLNVRIDKWIETIPQLNNWCHYQDIREKCIDYGMEKLIFIVESENISPNDVIDLFDRSYYQWWIDKIRGEDPIIRSFFKPDHEAMIRRLQEIDNEYQQLASEQIISHLYSRLYEWEDVRGIEKQILKTQMNKKKNNISLRLLFKNISNILPDIKPCMLMSPMSVSQYLSLNEKKFDVVIFDEASQIPIWDAIGAIARGNQIIVVGDPKQMPPSNLFQKIVSDDGGNDELFGDLENVLDDCIRSDIPQIHLKWHYRSRHESLIAFSNYWFYNNGLLTFPSSVKDSAVSLQRVPGIFDGGKGSHTNKKEAEIIVKEIIRRLLEPKLPRDSIGVVTFNQPQRDLIADLLEIEKQKNPQIIPLLNNVDEKQKNPPPAETFTPRKDLLSNKDEKQKSPQNIESSLFIKNLENVQGDERDVIFFSIVYGPDENGKVIQNFGPLNQDGGERRLNVAITRARKEIIVFSSLFPEHIQTSTEKGAGVNLLKSFLNYAEHGVIGEFKIGIPGKYESPFEEEVGTIIQKMGYEIHPQVGCLGYRIDMGVVDPEYPGRYLLGVECDGAQYHRLKTARDRDRLREEVLTGLGWKIHRIWSTDWWENQKDEIDRLEIAINDAKMKNR